MVTRVSAFTIALALSATAVYAQLNGGLTGTVVDPTGAAAANAKVSLFLPGGKTPLLATETNAEGSYSFSAVRPDLYRLVVELAGFTKYELAEVKVDPARQLGLPPIKLAVATSSQSVEVNANIQSVDTATAEISTTVTQGQITNLPVLGRQIVNLFNTQAGVTQNNRTATVINGMRPSYSNVTLDGINIQDSVRLNDIDLLNNRLTIAQVAEFTVSTTNSSPTIGGGTSTIVLSSPSGTNQLHGTAYWYNRNNFFGANDWFNNKNGITRPPVNLNQLGGTVGGAIIKDKLFFFGVYEAYRFHRQVPRTNTILTPTARQGILQYPVNGAVQQYDVLKAAGLPMSSAVQKFLALVPSTGNNSAIGDGLNTTGYTFNSRSNTLRDNVSGKVDYNHSTKHVFSGTYAWNRDVPDRNDGTYYTITPPTFNDNRINLVSASWRWTPKATLTNELRGGFEYAYVPFSVRQTNPAFFLTFPTNFLSTPLQNSEIGEGRRNHQYNFQDNANWIHGKHAVSFGFQASLLSANSYNYNGSVPVYTLGLGTSPFGFNVGDIPGANSTFTTTGNNILVTLGGLISSAQQGFNVSSRTSGFVPGAPSLLNQRWDQYALYALDNIKLRPNLTLTLGLRWDYFAPVDETDGLASMPRLINNNPITTLLGNATLDFTGNSVGRPFYKKDLNNFAPNVGLAWDPFGKGKTSIRAGFNIAYLNDNTLNSVYNSGIAVNNGLTSTRSLASLNSRADAPPAIATPAFQFPTTTLDQFNLSPTAPPVEGLIDPNLATPYAEQWVLSIQHEVKGFVLEGRYVGNHALKMFRGIDLNQVNIRQGDFLNDFVRARNNAFASLNAGKGFVPAYNNTVPGSQPLTYLTQLPAAAANAALTNATLLGNLRSGEIGTYAQTLMSQFPYPALGFSYFPNPYLLYATMLTNRSTANYNGLQLEVRKHMRSGLQLQANYTFSKALTDANALRSLDAQVDNSYPSAERARADYDLTHAFKFNYYYPLPIGTGHRFSSRNAVLKQALDGWALSGIGVIQTGSPVSILSARGTINRGARSGNSTVDTSLTVAQLHEITGLFMTGNGPYWLNPANIGPDTRGAAADGSAPFTGQVFFNPQPGTQGSLQKRALDGPPFRSFNFTVVKNFKITERHAVDLHADFFNIFNHPNFFLNDQNVNNTGFGRITTQNTSNDGIGPRVIQFGLNYRF